ncbi:DUF1289 domain-containing protein [Psychrobacter sp. YP14]|uniref:DUF1289 domain-containing protein n=3 Tax=Psychrobacter TaxID=497 RepID=A0A844M256_9GAMM|nr:MULTISPECIES: DUF1289 domain-containing protein [Psychrobacter]AWT49958.1 DUF1289 domain-containing protein [Psychrobacter sp. YP14]MUG32760.1 DUF1289 domain-containing protein [Psychrobacter sanguinis]
MFDQIELFAIENPCIGVCQSNKKGYCFGCLRSRTERQLWLQMTDEQKREVLRLIIGRKKRIEQMRLRQREQMELDFGSAEELHYLFDN